MKFKLGYENKAYIGTASAEPSAELKNITDLQVGLSRDAKDVTARYSGAFKIAIPGMIDPEISFTIHANSDSTDNTQQGIIRSAWLAGTAIAVKIELGDGYYFMSDCVVTDYSVAQNTEDPTDISVSLKPTIVDEDFPPVIAAVTTTGGGSSEG